MVPINMKSCGTQAYGVVLVNRSFLLAFTVYFLPDRTDRMLLTWWFEVALMSDTACVRGSRLSKATLTLRLMHVCGSLLLPGSHWHCPASWGPERKQQVSLLVAAPLLAPWAVTSPLAGSVPRVHVPQFSEEGRAWPLQRRLRVLLRDTNRPSRQFSWFLWSRNSGHKWGWLVSTSLHLGLSLKAQRLTGWNLW